MCRLNGNQAGTHAMDKTHSAGEQHHHDYMAEDFEALKRFWDRHGLKVTIGACALLAAVAVVRFHRGHTRRVNREAAAALASAGTVQDLETVVQDYRSAAVTPIAMLQLAKVYYDGDRLDQAMTTYESFLDRYGDHQLAPAARLGMAQVQEARGQLETAAKAFEKFAKDNPESFLAPQAVLGHARCLEQLGRREEARMIYEDFIVSHEADVWSARAHEALDDLANRPADAPSALLSAPAMPALDFGDAAIPTAPIVIAPPVETEQAPAEKAEPEPAEGSPEAAPEPLEVEAAE